MGTPLSVDDLVTIFVVFEGMDQSEPGVRFVWFGCRRRDPWGDSVRVFALLTETKLTPGRIFFSRATIVLMAGLSRASRYGGGSVIRSSHDTR